MELPGQAYIDNELLIKEIKKRPYLYDRTKKEYNSPIVRRRTWAEISEKVLHNYWSDWDQEKKEHAAQQVRKRWVNLKNCFVRERRLQKTPDAQVTKRRKYIYYDQMNFLLDLESKNNLSETQDDDSRTEEDFEQTAEFDQDEDFDESRDVQSIKGEQSYGEEIFLFNSNPLQNSTVNPLQETSKGDSNINTIDQDVNFAMSIVPMLRALPINAKLDIQIEILKLFKKVVQS